MSGPSPFGTTEKFIIRVPLPENIDTATLSFAVKAVDELGESGPLSNIASATLRRYIPTAPPLPPVELPTTTARTVMIKNPGPLPIPALVGGVLGAVSFCFVLAMVLFVLQKVVISKKVEPRFLDDDETPTHENKGYDYGSRHQTY